MDFASVLRDAIADLQQHGFDSVERVDRWLAALRLAARAQTGSADQAEAMVADGLASIYRRLVERGGVSRFNPGVQKFTLERVKPKLRAELDRRIRASADLIRNNREEAIEKTLRRFQGWATSVPSGGSDADSVRELKQDVAKPLRQLSFEERRVNIDQASKLTASISAILAKDTNAIAAVWHSNYRQKNYNARVDHKERDGKVYLMRDNWAQVKGLVKPGPAGYADEITQPAEEVFCLPGDSRIQLFNDAEKTFRRFYRGEIVRVTLQDGTRFSATPNHPVMTVNGWVGVGALNKGDNLIKIAKESVEASELHADQAFTAIADLHAAVRPGSSVKIRNGVPPDFHGDGMHDKVEIISLAGPLALHVAATKKQMLGQLVLAATNLLCTTVCTVGQKLRAARYTAASCMSFFTRDRFVHLNCGTAGFTDARYDGLAADTEDATELVAVFARFVATAKLGVIKLQSRQPASAGPQIDKPAFVPVPDSHSGGADCVRDFRNALPFRTEAVDVINVEREQFAAHVYNLQTTSGWYGVESVITSNCRCSYKYLYNLRALPSDMLTKLGQETLAEARAKASQMLLGAPS